MPANIPPSLCSCRDPHIPISIAVIGGVLLYIFLTYFLLIYVPNEPFSPIDIPMQLYRIFGIVFGYEETNITTYFLIVLCIGCVIGAFSISASRAFIASFVFILTLVILFFIIGLLFLGVSTDYDQFTNGIGSAYLVLFPTIFISSMLVGGYLSSHVSPTKSASIAVYRKYNSTPENPSIIFRKLN